MLHFSSLFLFLQCVRYGWSCNRHLNILHRSQLFRSNVKCIQIREIMITRKVSFFFHWIDRLVYGKEHTLNLMILLRGLKNGCPQWQTDQNFPYIDNIHFVNIIHTKIGKCECIDKYCGTIKWMSWIFSIFSTDISKSIYFSFFLKYNIFQLKFLIKIFQKPTFFNGGGQAYDNVGRVNKIKNLAPTLENLNSRMQHDHRAGEPRIRAIGKPGEGVSWNIKSRRRRKRNNHVRFQMIIFFSILKVSNIIESMSSMNLIINLNATNRTIPWIKPYSTLMRMTLKNLDNIETLSMNFHHFHEEVVVSLCKPICYNCQYNHRNHNHLNDHN